MASRRSPDNRSPEDHSPEDRSPGERRSERSDRRAARSKNRQANSSDSGFTAFLTTVKGGLLSPTTVFIGKRLLQALLTLLIASFLSFIVIQLAPGDYLDSLRENPQFSDYVQTLEQKYGLDRPWIEQYFRWIWRIVRYGDFGDSFTFKRSVTSLLIERVPATLLLAFSSLVMTWAIAVPLGIYSAVNQNKWGDRILRVLSYLGQGFPSFITALLLLIMAQFLTPLLPVGDMTSIEFADYSILGKILDLGWHLILPTLALSIASFAGLQRITRGQMLEVMRQDYIRTARAKGLPENRVIYRHALRNAINPLITLLGFEFGNLLSGAFIAEVFFNWPGLGNLTLKAVFAQDLFLVMASLLMGAVMLIVGNLFADLLLSFADPRIELGKE